jgi:hypothetical protein
MKANITIEGLRKSGFKVFVKHHGNYSTEIYITDPTGNHSYGMSQCSFGDQPNRKLGNKIALGRALKNMRGKIFCAFPIDKTVEL